MDSDANPAVAVPDVSFSVVVVVSRSSSSSELPPPPPPPPLPVVLPPSDDVEGTVVALELLSDSPPMIDIWLQICLYIDLNILNIKVLGVICVCRSVEMF